MARPNPRVPEKRSRPAAPTVRTARAAAAGPAWEPGLAWVVAAPLLAAAIVHGGALAGFFAADDLDFLMRARGLDATPWSWARPLPGWLRWEAFTAWFGVTPLPHLALAWLLHAGAALLVARVALLAGLGRRAAIVAGVLAAGASVAYSGTYWASGLGEVMAAAFALGALVLHLECRLAHRPALAWLAGLAAVAAVLSKESALLLPFAILAFDQLVPVRGEGRGAMREVGTLGTLVAVAVLVAYLLAPHVAGEAYALSRSPGDWFFNALTYAAWLVRITDPIRDRLALPDAGLAPWGSLVIAAALFAAWTERGRASRPVTAGLAWCALLLAPVVPLVRHTHLYYLVTPFAGIALAVGALAARFTARLPARHALLAIVLPLVAWVANEALQIRARRTFATGEIVVDRVARESALLRNTLAGLRAANVAAGDTIALINPFPPRAPGVVRPAGEGFSEHAYIPLVAALRGGPALALFRPDVTLLGMGDGIPRAWERARVFRFANDGRLTDLGRGAAALDSLASDYLEGQRFDEARLALERTIALGGDGPEVRWRLGKALASLGDDAGGFAQAQIIMERWPDSPRARQLRENAQRAGQTVPGAP